MLSRTPSPAVVSLFLLLHFCETLLWFHFCCWCFVGFILLGIFFVLFCFVWWWVFLVVICLFSFWFLVLFWRFRVDVRKGSHLEGSAAWEEVTQKWWGCCAWRIARLGWTNPGLTWHTLGSHLTLRRRLEERSQEAPSSHHFCDCVMMSGFWCLHAAYKHEASLLSLRQPVVPLALQWFCDNFSPLSAPTWSLPTLHPAFLTRCSSLCCQSHSSSSPTLWVLTVAEEVPYVGHKHLNPPQACAVGTGNAEGSTLWQSKDAPCLCSGGAGILLANLSQGFLQKFTWSNFGVKFLWICNQRKSQERSKSLWTIWVIQIQSHKTPLQVFHYWF